MTLAIETTVSLASSSETTELTVLHHWLANPVDASVLANSLVVGIDPPLAECPPVVSVALIGNPNTGKSTLFGELVGSHQRVGNYPGVTVEKKTGEMTFAGQRYEIVDRSRHPRTEATALGPENVPR